MGRLATLAFGLFAYAVFFVTILYAIGFVGNVLVPRGIDGPPVDASWRGWLINLGLLALFAVQHSVMARRGFKAWWTKIVPKPAERSVFVLAASLILLLLFWQWRAMPATVWRVEAAWAAALLWTIFGFGWALVFLSTFLIDHFELFGLKQTWSHFRGKAPGQVAFKTPWLYRWVRHPLYLGFILAFWATPHMTLGHLLFAVGTTGYIVLAIVAFEEPDLIRHFGDQYREYRKRVPMLIPLPRRPRDSHEAPAEPPVSGPASVD